MGVKPHSASTESSAKLRAERKAGQQMGHGGQGERGDPKYLLTHCQRYWAAGVLAPDGGGRLFDGKQGGTAELEFLSLFP